MNEELTQILDKGHTYLENGQRKLRPHAETSISPRKVEFLHQLVSDLRPTTSVEVGLAYGVSALTICDVLAETPDARHIVMDPMQSTKFENVGLDNLTKAGYGDLVEFHEAPSHRALPQLAANDLTIDFAFVDGAHWYDSVLLDFFNLDLMLRPGGVIAFDDTCEKFAGIRKALRFILSNRSYTVFRCMPGRRGVLADLRQRLQFRRSDSQLGIVRGSPLIALRKEHDDDRPWNFFRDF